MLDSNLFDFPRFFGVVQSTNGLKRNQTRPLRSEIIEYALEKYSGNQLKYIGDKHNGVDFLSENEDRYELKCMDGVFQKTVPYTKPITLVNFYSVAHELDRTFDYLLMVDTLSNSIGVCDWECATKDLVYNDATVTIRVHHDDITFLVKNVDCTPFVSDFATKLNQFIRESI
jgi:hypothetical protein